MVLFFLICPFLSFLCLTVTDFILIFLTFTPLEDRRFIFNSTNGCLLVYDIHNLIYISLILKD